MLHHSYVAHHIDRKNLPPPGVFSIYYVLSSRTVCKRTPIEDPGTKYASFVCYHMHIIRMCALFVYINTYIYICIYTYIIICIIRMCSSFVYYWSYVSFVWHTYNVCVYHLCEKHIICVCTHFIGLFHVFLCIIRVLLIISVICVTYI